MNDSTGGFSFGGASNKDMRGEDEEVDAIEVSGEPVSRSEAKTLGFATMDSIRESHSSSSAIPHEALPDDIPEALRKKLERAWNHLKKNEIEEALTLGQEVVFEHPSLVAAKIIIARCFINRKEYDKALAILLAISEEDRTAEAMYYIGLCQSRLGRIKDAIDTLKMCRSASSDGNLRKRANDLLLHLQGEQTVCPVCGKKTLYDSMVDAGNQTVCVNCAKKIAESEDEDDFEDDEDEELSPGRKRRRKLRPPLTKTEILIRFVFVVFLVVMAAFAVYALSIVSPGHYASLRGYLPASWTFLPEPVNTGSDSVPIVPAHVPTPAPQPASTIAFDSPPLSHAIVGMEIRHKLVIDGMEGREGMYGAAFYPEPHGRHLIDSETGEFTWTPGEEDAGKNFEITFSGLFGNLRIRDQVNNVYVSPGPKFTNITSWNTPVAGEILQLVAEDMTNSGHNNLIVVSGEFWQGEIGAFSETPDGYFNLETRTSISGRPIAAGIIVADGEKWLAVADYWNSRLRHYALRSGNMSEMAVDIDLPGRPLLAGFDKESATSAVLCRTDDTISVVSYRQESQLNSLKIGEWTVSGECVWKRLLVLPEDEDAAQPPVPLLIGSDPANSIFLLERGNSVPRPIRLPVEGVIVDAILSPDGLVYCLIENAGELVLVSFRPGRDGRAFSVTTAKAGKAPALGGLAAARYSGNGGAADLLLLSSGKIGISFMSATGGLGSSAYWDLPKPSRLNGGMVTLPATKELPTRVAYMDADGEIWAIDVTAKGE